MNSLFLTAALLLLVCAYAIKEDCPACGDDKLEGTEIAQADCPMDAQAEDSDSSSLPV